ncbi:MAG: hypothetical protein U0P30_03780 [Vicinamibacterales bacterium]
MSRPPAASRPALVDRAGTLLLLAAVAWQLVQSTLPYDYLSVQVLAADDAFYYLTIVRNVVRLGWSTFDGMHAASGVQLLWSFLLAPFAWLVDDRMGLVRVVLVLCAALNLTTGLLLRRLATRLHTPRTGEGAAAAWATVLMVWLTPSLTAMEYPLHTLLIVSTLLVWWPLVSAPETATRSRVAWLGVCLTLNYWTRLDSAYYSVLLAAVAAWQLGRRPAPLVGRRAEIATLAAPIVAGAGGYALTCYLMAGTWTPISGIVKGLYASRYFAGQPWTTAWRERVEWWFQIQAQPLVDLVATPLGVAAWGLREKLVACAAGLLLAAWAAWRMWRRDPAGRPLAAVVGTLLVFGAGHVALVIASVAHFSYVTRHYYGWTQVAWCLWFAYALSQLLDGLGERVRRPLVGAVAVAVVAAQVVAIGPRFDPEALEGLRAGRWRAMAWVTEHLPPGAPIGAWNAGQVAYFLDRPVVNLDGLVNDIHYVDVLRGERTLQDYLQREGIHYLMDYNEVDLSMPYHAYWKRNERFRNVLPWRDLTVLHVEPAGDRAVQVVELTPGLGAPPAEATP